MTWAEPRYLRRPWAEFLGKLDDAQYPIEVIRHPSCNAQLRFCEADHWPQVGFALVLVGDVEDLLTYRQV